MGFNLDKELSDFTSMNKGIRQARASREDAAEKRKKRASSSESAAVPAQDSQGDSFSAAPVQPVETLEYGDKGFMYRHGGPVR